MPAACCPHLPPGRAWDARTRAGALERLGRGVTCRKRGRDHPVAGLRCLCEGAWLCPRETKRLCPQARRLAGGEQGPARGYRGAGGQAGWWWPPPTQMLGTRRHPLPNVNSDRSQLRVQHRCLIKRCMVTSCSVGTAHPHPTTLSVAKWWGEGFYYTKAVSKLIFPSLLCTLRPVCPSQLTHLIHGGQGMPVVTSLLCLWDPLQAAMS